ncbi:unnamed protein product [Triticum turgidum subsp. durum]|uniref:non-specific serine/threonine protein kinase n=3 Tax=Triticinae TaxID=1648030 RepID=A0A9R1NP92_TRITD|nr:unnamed protein product [Triticum turgidum subsp. durum]
MLKKGIVASKCVRESKSVPPRSKPREDGPSQPVGHRRQDNDGSSGCPRVFQLHLNFGHAFTRRQMGDAAEHLGFDGQMGVVHGHVRKCARIHGGGFFMNNLEEVDPTGRFGRYAAVLGLGSVKKVYRGFDQEEGIEVAWNRVRLRALAERDPSMVDRLHAEVRLLRSLHHDHIIGFHKVWLDRDAGVLNFITEVCNSGSLREYRDRHKHVSLKALKKWARQILEGLDHLHTHDPCIIHRDLNCSNVFINGNTGQVKIGDLGLAAIVDKDHTAHTILGTPEFMAPELYSETYTESVDIYSYGMCVLEMVTREMPYGECESVVQIYHSVTNGVPPAALRRLRDPEMRAFIQRCIGKPRNRPSAADLLRDPFFHGIDDDTTGTLS